MFLETMSIDHFRNYDHAELEFGQDVTLFLGQNAQGKTNVLEAIYTLAMAKSHRTTTDKDLIQWQAEYAKIEGRVRKRGQSVPMSLIVTNKGKKAKVNHLEQKRLSNYIGHLNVVMFAPEDLSLVKGSPSVRRRFIDMELGQMLPIYLYDLTQFQRILQQRNHYLKRLQTRKTTDTTMLDVLDEQYSELAAKITLRRRDFVVQLSEYAIPIHSEISRQKETLEIHYESSVKLLEAVAKDKELDEVRAQLITDLQSKRQREIDRGVSLIGPHRDDLTFIVNERNVQVFGSQGQQRTTALAVKLAEIDLIFQETNEYPLLLLDDVLSELDEHRQTHLLNAIQGKVQTFVTATGVEGIHHQTLADATCFYVEEGTIKKMDEVDNDDR
ncbi:DNA replication/repair protein RecF [Brochothrix thermosphacta]|uniref:DNA replication/repair protein RecF n=1 Tax=Brochothrix thermosphacta TaxID=2756 RepID=UPI0003E8AF8E|nr:DNA replication/repair protein RecF [Brochothrix thermosphacta]ANZ96556.1 DNA replication/repair protein RecF [Brochothrix thermosphacta]EUJ36633.1 recombination protein F [Brochothrix thermosphacta DSM 20171 = FSL F6-1036]MDO7864187.1 DNA replication/repair protein RecF [Brochothrix thermosphacta]ODJ49056.1 DNA replication/repair protein RecF [Brochothrix thermosphacta DSM 20171 = FSL F6-1036]ODJ65606.1 DNA replication/repair protein RecF [Brochothrix thermosphacta]